LEPIKDHGSFSFCSQIIRGYVVGFTWLLAMQAKFEGILHETLPFWRLKVGQGKLFHLILRARTVPVQGSE